MFIIHKTLSKIEFTQMKAFLLPPTTHYPYLSPITIASRLLPTGHIYTTHWISNQKRTAAMEGRTLNPSPIYLIFFSQFTFLFPSYVLAIHDRKSHCLWRMNYERALRWTHRVHLLAFRLHIDLVNCVNGDVPFQPMPKRP